MPWVHSVLSGHEDSVGLKEPVGHFQVHVVHDNVVVISDVVLDVFGLDVKLDEIPVGRTESVGEPLLLGFSWIFVPDLTSCLHLLPLLVKANLPLGAVFIDVRLALAVGFKAFAFSQKSFPSSLSRLCGLLFVVLGGLRGFVSEEGLKFFLLLRAGGGSVIGETWHFSLLRRV